MMYLNKSFCDAVEAASTTAPDELILLTLRHGESLGQRNIAAYKELGDHAIPITRLGIRQSIAAANIIGRLSFAAKFNSLQIISSTGERAETTAEILYDVLIGTRKDLALLKDGRLDKQKFGRFDGFFSDEERARSVPADYQTYLREEAPKGKFFARPPKGESIADVQDRMEECLAELMKNPKPTIIVTHGTNTLCIDNILLGLGEEWVLDNIDKRPNCSVHLITGSAEGGFKKTILAQKPLKQQMAGLNLVK